MDDMIYRNDPIAEENLNPDGHPAKMTLKNGAKKFPNVQIPATRIKR